MKSNSLSSLLLLSLISISICISDFKLPSNGAKFSLQNNNSQEKEFTSNSINDFSLSYKIKVIKGNNCYISAASCHEMYILKKGEEQIIFFENKKIRRSIVFGSTILPVGSSICSNIEKLNLKLDAFTEVEIEETVSQSNPTKPINPTNPIITPIITPINPTNPIKPVIPTKPSTVFPKPGFDHLSPPSFKPISHNLGLYDVILNQDRIKIFREEHLSEHNRRRKDHNAIPLKTNSILQSYAQQYTEWLIQFRSCTMKNQQGSSHSPKALYRIYPGSEKSEQFVKGNNIFGKDYWDWTINAYDSFGENLSYSQSLKNGKDCTGEMFNNLYYDELPEYYEANPNYNPDHNSSAGGHFTQQVWKGSSEIGIGYAECYNKQTKEYICISVSNYYKGGNEYKKYSENVELPKEPLLSKVLAETRGRRFSRAK